MKTLAEDGLETVTAVSPTGRLATTWGQIKKPCALATFMLYYRWRAVGHLRCDIYTPDLDNKNYHLAELMQGV